MAFITDNTQWFFLLLFGIIAAVTGFTLYQYDLPLMFCISDSIISAGLLVLSIWIGILTVNNYPTKVGILVYALLVGTFTGIVAWSLDKLALKWWFDTEPKYLEWLKTTQLPRLIIAILTSCWVISFTAIQRTKNVLEDQFKNTTDAATLHREAELFKLRQQLQPHFLYNSLNSINALILIQPDKAQEMIGKLSDFLRNSVKREGREQIPIDEELEYIEAYLAIEAVRFGDRLKVIYEKDEVGDAVVPPFLLQPILENAIKFGLYGRTGAVVIHMHITLQSSYLIVTITNPYDVQNKPPSGTGFGLGGIQRRLYLLYARADLLEIRPATRKDETGNEIFTTILKIPQGNV